jgi:hypothetical protein
MGNDDPREVALAFLTSQSFVTTETKGPGGWVGRTGGGGWPRQFYAGGAIEEGNGIARVLLRSANGVELEDTVEQGEVLFMGADAIQTPLEVELYDGAGNLAGSHMLFTFTP